jgi:broad specificity phosphatase PhoE
MAPAQTLESDTENTVIFLVRHAEKQTTSEDPALTEEGQKRAVRLSRLLSDGEITRIYSTPFKRTRQTAQPLAQRLKLAITEYDYQALPQFAESLSSKAERILVVGHSNTTPQLVELLGGNPGTPIDEKSEYDRLYMVTLTPNKEVSTVLLRYGN